MIGISSKNAERTSHWLDHMIDSGFKLIEINHRMNDIKFDDLHIEITKNKIKKNKLKITMHSGVTDLINKDKMIRDYQDLLIRSEIKYASKVGINHIVFHLPKYLDPKRDKKKIESYLSRLLSYAGRKGVRLFLENDSYGPWAFPENTLPLFKRFKLLSHNLDIGHLHLSVMKGLIDSEESYIDILKDHIGYVHIHGNHGIWDEHIGIGSGNMRLDIVLPLLKKIKPEIIIVETYNMKEEEKTVDILKKFGFN